MATSADDAVSDLSESFLRILDTEGRAGGSVTPRCIRVLLEREEDLAKEEFLSRAVERASKDSDEYFGTLMRQTEDLRVLVESGRAINEVAETKAHQEIQQRNQRLSDARVKMENYYLLMAKYEDALKQTIRALKSKIRGTVARKTELERRWLELKRNEESAPLIELLETYVSEIKQYIEGIKYEDDEDSDDD